MNIKINNFQIIKEASIDLLSGVTIVVGQSNNGKTSILRALDVVLYPDKFYKYFITSGRDQSSIQMTSERGTLLLSLGRSKAKELHIDGERVPLDVGKKWIRDTFGLKTIKVGTESYDVNVWRQMDRPFLMQTSPQALFDFFSTASHQDGLQKAESIIEQDKKKLRIEKTKVEGAIEYNRAELSKCTARQAKYEGYKHVYSLAEQATSLLSTYEKAVAYYEQLKSIFDQAKKHAAKLDSIKGLLAETESMMYNGIQVVKKIGIGKELYQKAKELDDMIKSSKDDIDNINKFIKNYEDSNIEHQMNDYLHLKGTLEKAHKYYRDLSQRYSVMKDAHEKIGYYKAAISELDNYLSSFTACPVCHRPWEDKDGRSSA